MQTTLIRSLLIALLAVPASAFALALTTGTQRAVRNMNTAFKNLELVPAFRSAKIEGPQMQTAKNLLRDLDSALSRGHREFDGIVEADRSDAEVMALGKQIDELEAYKADLQRNIEGGAAASAANDAVFRAFKEDTRKYERAVTTFRDGARGGPAELQAAAAQLAELDALCRSKYPTITNDPKLSFALAIEPATWCATAAAREGTMKKSLSEGVAGSLARVTSQVEGARRKLAGNGFLTEEGLLAKLVTDRAGGKAELTVQLKPSLDAAGLPMGPDFFAGLDKELDAYAAEIDRLAPTWPFEPTLKDPALEGGAAKRFAAVWPNGKVLRSGMLYADWSIDKNKLGIPTERYRTGAVLAKVPGEKWCVYREFTKHETYAGGGTFQSGNNITFGAKRLQKCP